MFSEGFRIFENVLSESECDSLIHHLCRDSSRAGVRHLMKHPMVARLARDERLIAITEQAFDRPLIPFKATLFQKSGRANWLVAWHQDTALPLSAVPNAEGWGPVSEKDNVTFVHAPTSALVKILALRVHLDDSSDRNGPLRVIPRSHRKRLRNDAEFSNWTSREPVTCLVKRGGIIAMSPLLIHASSKVVGDEQRRVLHLEYTADLNLVGGVRLAVA